MKIDEQKRIIRDTTWEFRQYLSAPMCNGCSNRIGGGSHFHVSREYAAKFVEEIVDQLNKEGGGG